jgi:hypothetical protein
MENLELNKTYSFTSHSGKKCVGKYIGKDDRSNIVFHFTETHPFNLDKNGNAVFFLSEYFFFKHFNPILIN